MASMMQTMHDPTYRARLEAKMGALKEDPELADVMQQLEAGGPAAMMKCASPLHTRCSCSGGAWAPSRVHISMQKHGGAASEDAIP